MPNSARIVKGHELLGEIAGIGVIDEARGLNVLANAGQLGSP